ncbi:MAG: hypothetical protein D6714_08770, partial [Bacteroidetes bacterium]
MVPLVSGADRRFCLSGFLPARVSVEKGEYRAAGRRRLFFQFNAIKRLFIFVFHRSVIFHAHPIKNKSKFIVGEDGQINQLHFLTFPDIKNSPIT